MSLEYRQVFQCLSSLQVTQFFWPKQLYAYVEMVGMACITIPRTLNKSLEVPIQGLFIATFTSKLTELPSFLDQI